MENLFRKSLNNVPGETKALVAKLFDITDQVLDILERKGITQKEFAGLLGKRESEISKWMKGTHNFTEETIARIEFALGEKITLTVKQANEKYQTIQRKLEKKELKLKQWEKKLKHKEVLLKNKELKRA